MILRFKKLLPGATIPKYAKPGDAALDLVAMNVVVEAQKDYIMISTGLAVEIPEGHVGLVFPRSSISSTDMMLANGVGVIDSGYRGEIMCRFKINNELKKRYGKG